MLSSSETGPPFHLVGKYSSRNEFFWKKFGDFVVVSIRTKRISMVLSFNQSDLVFLQKNISQEIPSVRANIKCSKIYTLNLKDYFCLNLDYFALHHCQTSLSNMVAAVRWTNMNVKHGGSSGTINVNMVAAVGWTNMNVKHGGSSGMN